MADFAPEAMWAALARIHPPAVGWAFFREVRGGTAWGEFNSKSIDAWAICTWRSRRGARGAYAPYLRRSFEVKMTRSDAIKDLRDPDKRWYAYAISHEFYFVAPPDVVMPKDLGPDDGLLTWDGERLVYAKSPRVRNAMPPRWAFVAHLARIAAKAAEAPPPTYRFDDRDALQMELTDQNVGKDLVVLPEESGWHRHKDHKEAAA